MSKIIGICGPSGSGKTTIANLLATEFDAQVIGLDNYFLLNTPYRKYNEQGKDLELPQNTDWDAIHNLIDSVKAGNEITIRKVSWENNNYTEYRILPKNLIILEGFLLFHDPGLVEKLNFSTYIDISDEIGTKRRVGREGSKENREWFEQVTFPEYAPRRKIYESRADLVLDGNSPIEKNVEILKKYIEKI